MNILVVGAGKVGRYLIDGLRKNHAVTAMEQDEVTCHKVQKDFPDVTVYCRDGCEPRYLEEAGAGKAEIVAAVTGHDEDNLVVAQLARYEFRVPRIVARNNNPRNLWLFTRKWGVDVVVSAPQIILSLIEEEMTLGDVVTLLKLKAGELSLVEVTLPENTRAKDKEIRDVGFPPDSVVVTIIRDNELIIPKGTTTFLPGDEVLIVASPEVEATLRQLLAG